MGVNALEEEKNGEVDKWSDKEDGGICTERDSCKTCCINGKCALSSWDC